MKKLCEFCSGTGQIGFFKGVSRFLLSREECPECAGVGYHLSAEAEKKQPKENITIEDHVFITH